MLADNSIIEAEASLLPPFRRVLSGLGSARSLAVDGCSRSSHLILRPLGFAVAALPLAACQRNQHRSLAHHCGAQARCRAHGAMLCSHTQAYGYMVSHTSGVTHLQAHGVTHKYTCRMVSHTSACMVSHTSILAAWCHTQVHGRAACKHGMRMQGGSNNVARTSATHKCMVSHRSIIAAWCHTQVHACCHTQVYTYRMVSHTSAWVRCVKTWQRQGCGGGRRATRDPASVACPRPEGPRGTCECRTAIEPALLNVRTCEEQKSAARNA